MNKSVSFPIAKLLKEKGFEQKNISDHYLEDGTIDTSGLAWLNALSFGSTPTIAEVVMWLYEKHGIWITLIAPHQFYPYWQCKIYKINGTGLTEWNNDSNSPTEAYEAAIEYCLNNLIK